MTPTREQFDQWFAERYPDTTSVYSEFKSTTVRDLMRQAHAAGRDQGLREATGVCEAMSARVVKANTSRGRTNSAAVFSSGLLDDCAAAIEQLRASA